MIEKPSIIITSLGRTGTTFFAALFKEIISDSNSFHEPDIFQFYTKDRFGAFIERVQNAGVYNMIIKKMLGGWSMIKLSDMRIRGELTYDQAAKHVLEQRYNFVNSKKGSVYIESNAGYYGLIDVLENVYSQHKAIFMIRDGRKWISSAMAVGELYADRGIRDVFAHQMPAASQFMGDPLFDAWHSSSRFVKLCWAWNKINSYAVQTISKNPNAQLFKFEDIFTGDNKYQNLTDLVNFATSMPDLINGNIGSTNGWLEKKINQSENNLGNWSDWSLEQKSQFEKICGSLMEKVGYQI